MDDDAPVSTILARLTEIKGLGRSPDGLVEVEVDGTSDIVNLSINPKAMRLASFDLADAIRNAFQEARTMAQKAMREIPPPAYPDDIRDTLSFLEDDARRRLSELTATAQELSDHLHRMT